MADPYGSKTRLNFITEYLWLGGTAASVRRLDTRPLDDAAHERGFLADLGGELFGNLGIAGKEIPLLGLGFERHGLVG